MIQKENNHKWLNRIMSFLFGGLLVFAAMSLAVTAPLKSQSTALTMQLDEIRYGPDRLLGEANVFVQRGSYEEAISSLDSLFEKHPATTQAAEGAVLYRDIEATLQDDEMKWDAALETVKTAWENTRAEEIRADFEVDRALMETNMAETLAKEWEESKATIQEEWMEL